MSLLARAVLASLLVGFREQSRAKGTWDWYKIGFNFGVIVLVRVTDGLQAAVLFLAKIAGTEVLFRGSGTDEALLFEDFYDFVGLPEADKLNPAFSLQGL